MDGIGYTLRFFDRRKSTCRPEVFGIDPIENQIPPQNAQKWDSGSALDVVQKIDVQKGEECLFGEYECPSVKV